MPAKDSTIYVRFPSQSKNPVLHPATVVRADSTKLFAVRSEDDTLSFEVGLEILIYFDLGGKFVQQPARIEALLEDDPEAGIELVTIGEWFSAENRNAYRISTVTSDLVTTFGGEQNCPLCDVSIGGFAAIVSGKYEIGQVVDVEISYDNKTYTGQVSIQSARELRDGKTRYGANCVKAASSATSLNKGIQTISMSEQRKKLNRLSRGA